MNYISRESLMSRNNIALGGAGIALGLAYYQWGHSDLAPDQILSSELRNKLVVILAGSLFGGAVSATSQLFSKHSQSIGVACAASAVLSLDSALTRYDPFPLLISSVKTYLRGTQWQDDKPAVMMIASTCIGTLVISRVITHLVSVFFMKKAMKNVMKASSFDEMHAKTKESNEKKIQALSPTNAKDYLLAELKFWNIQFVPDSDFDQEAQCYILALLLTYQKNMEPGLNPHEEHKGASKKDDNLPKDIIDGVIKTSSEKFLESFYDPDAVKRLAISIHKENISGIKDLASPECPIM